MAAFRVIGKGVVTIVDPGGVTHTNEPDISPSDPISIHGLQVHLLSHGDRFDYRHRKVIEVAHGSSS